jgi:hypothetical protein
MKPTGGMAWIQRAVPLRDPMVLAEPTGKITPEQRDTEGSRTGEHMVEWLFLNRINTTGDHFAIA